MRLLLIGIALVCCLSIPAHAGRKVVLVSLEWPPYTGEHLPQQGASAIVVRSAFKAVGYDLEIRFVPWNRALEMARHSQDVIGYFPEYPSEEVSRDFLFSDDIGKSPIGFAERRANNFSWNDYDDLKQYLIGIVGGYVNTEEFDAMVASGEIRTDTSVSDVLNLRKVLAGRVDYAVVDSNVYEYYLRNDPMLHSRRGELRMDSKLMGINTLVVCFRKDEAGRKMLRLFNSGLESLRPMAIQDEYIHSFSE